MHGFEFLFEGVVGKERGWFFFFFFLFFFFGDSFDNAAKKELDEPVSP